MKFGSVCSGIEAASVAWEPLGWKAQWFSEIDPFCCALLGERFPDIPNLGDTLKLRERFREEPADIDILVGGTPCQPISAAGKRGGMDVPRFELTREYVRLAGELQPQWIVWENPTGIFSIDEGRIFSWFIRSLEELGFGLAWRVFDAQYAGVPQRRKRVFVAGYFGGDWRPPCAVLFESESLRGDNPPSRKAREEVTGPLVTRATGGCVGNDFDTSGGLVEVAGTLPSRGDSGGLGTDFDLDGGVVAFGGGRTSGERDVAARLSAHGRRIDFEVEAFVTHALTAEGFDASEDGAGRGCPLVAMSENADGEMVPVFTQTPPLTGQHYGDNASREGLLIPFDETQITSRENRSNPKAGDPSPTLNESGRAPTIAFDARQADVCVYGDQAGTLDTASGTIGIRTHDQIRRLNATRM